MRNTNCSCKQALRRSSLTDPNEKNNSKFLSAKIRRKNTLDVNKLALFNGCQKVCICQPN